MIEIFHDPSSMQIRIRYDELEIRARGVIDIPGCAEPAIDESGNLGRSTRRLIVHVRDVIVMNDDGARSLSDGIYEVTSEGMLRLSPLLSEASLRGKLARLDQPVQIPADASELSA